MGGQQSQVKEGLGAHSTAKEVVETFGEGKYLNGRVAIVTGGSSGIGLETCKALASAGARVILCGITLREGEDAVKREILQPGHGGYTIEDPSLITVKALDLGDLSSVKLFADDILATEPRIDFLIYNAGIMALPYPEYTNSGFEKQIGINHYGHFYLNHLLLPRLLHTKDTLGRVVVLSSVAHEMGEFDWNDLHYKNGRAYGYGWPAYGQSKLANLLFAKELADRLANTNITVVAVHPGLIQTNLWKQSLLNRLLSYSMVYKSIPQGAATTLWGALAPRASTPALSGAYLVDCRPGVPTERGRDEDKVLRKKLWKVTEEELKVALKKVGIDESF